MRKQGSTSSGERSNMLVKPTKRHRKLIFELGDWVWLHMHKERFPNQRHSKLLTRGDGLFQVLERINDNAYKLDLPGQNNVSATFNVSDLSPLDTSEDLRANPLQKEGNDKAKDPVLVPVGPVTRARAKRFKEALNTLAQHIMIEEGKSTCLESTNTAQIVNLIQVQACK
jgi:hypothetical protein